MYTVLINIQKPNSRNETFTCTQSKVKNNYTTTKTYSILERNNNKR